AMPPTAMRSSSSPSATAFTSTRATTPALGTCTHKWRSCTPKIRASRRPSTPSDRAWRASWPRPCAPTPWPAANEAPSVHATQLPGDGELASDGERGRLSVQDADEGTHARLARVGSRRVRGRAYAKSIGEHVAGQPSRALELAQP